MIEITDRYLCCGCEACAQACPAGCITMERDNEGFMYPKVNHEQCIKCGKCLRVCPELKSHDSRPPMITQAMQNLDNDVRIASSSGGVFSLLAQQTITRGGIVFGAVFSEDHTVSHSHTESIDGIAAMRGSKYMQSRIGDSFKQAREFLQQGREVLFSGTPCQIAGLMNFLGESYDNLTTASIVCHSVASPVVWCEYIRENHASDYVTDTNFRDKTHGWKHYSIRIGKIKQPHVDNHYMHVFLERMSIRPSCSQCPAKSGKSGADIILGDLWGIENIAPEMDDDNGTTLAIAYSTKGAHALQQLQATKCTIDYHEALKHNPSLEHSVSENSNRNFFFWTFRHFGFNRAYRASISQSLWARISRRLFRAAISKD